jgi:predicted nucleotidyltransferase
MILMAFESYVAGYRRRLEAERETREADRRRLLERIQGLEEYFHGLPGLMRVYVFGSTTDPDRYEQDSDVDLAFEGLPPERFTSVLSALVERIERSVDAVRIEDVGGVLRERILRGVVVYERRTGQDP